MSSCNRAAEIPVRDGERPRAKPTFGHLLGYVRTAATSAALFSLFFVGDGLLAWCGIAGVVPILLHRAGCATCAGDPRRRIDIFGPGH